MKQSGIAEREWCRRWPAWLVVHERLPAAAVANALFALFVAGILGYGAAFAWYMLDRFDLFNLLRDVSYDDAFYYYQIAYHMAEGRFSTFDGGLTRTNGYHPLWLLLLTPFYWVFDKTEALFAFKALEIVLIAGGVALVAVAARVARLPWFLLFAVLPALYAQTGMLFGLEAALVLFMLGLLLLAMCLFARDPARWRRPLAAVAFALPWARLECAAVAVAAATALGFLEWSGRLSRARDGSTHGAAGRADRALPRLSPGGGGLRLQAAMPLAGAIAGVLVYFAYNGIVFGGIVPVSGAVKALLSQREWEREGGYGLAESVEAFARSEPFDDELLTALEVVFYALLAWWLGRGSGSRKDALLLAFAAGVFGLAAGHLAKFAQSVLLMHPELWFSWWYYVPAYLMEALVVPLRCCIGIYLVRRFVAPRLPRTADVLRLAAIVATAAVLVAKADFAAPFRFVDAARDEVKTKDWLVRAYMGVAVMDRLLPEGTLVGSWDGGAIGYFSRLPVMNLDGLANSYGYKEAIEEDSVGVFWWRHGLFHFSNVYQRGFPGKQTTVLWNQAMPIQSTPRGPLSRADVGKSATQSDPFHRGATWGSGLDLRVEDDHLVYAKAPCTPNDVAHSFLLHVYPVSVDDLPNHRKRSGFADLGFRFKAPDSPVRLGSSYRSATLDFEDPAGGDGACMVRAALPDYDIGYLRTGQYIPDVDYLFKAARGSRLRWGGLQFKLFSYDPEWALSQTDGASWFRERIAPHLEPQADGTGLFVEGRTAQAFAWDCVADGNDVAEWTIGGKVEAVSGWTQTADGLCSSDILLPHGHRSPLRIRRATLAVAAAGLAGGGPPAIHGDSTRAGGFDVYLAEDALVYVKAACERADVDTTFFLHLVPTGDDFDEGREAHGFNNFDFMLEHHGDWFGEDGDGGPCLAEVPLPDYGIAEIRTGQYLLEEGLPIVWKGEIHLADDWGN